MDGEYKKACWMVCGCGFWDPLWPAKKCGNVRAWSVSSEKSKVFEPPGNFFG